MSRASDMNDSQMFLGAVRELYGRVVWTHKTHEKDREIWSHRVRKTRWVNVVLIGATFVFAVSGAITNAQVFFIITSLLGALGTVFTIHQLSFNPEKIESDHRMAAKRLLYLRDRYLVLIQETMSGRATPDQLQSKLESLQREVATVYEYAPDTSSKAYKVASEALKTGEELTFSSEEIDRLLPEDLRLSEKTQQDGKEEA